MFSTIQQKRLGLVSALLWWCILLVSVRMQRTGNFYFMFLWWNLFLALVPLLASSALQSLNPRRRPVASMVVFGVWLLFLPNAFYIVTDLVHLAHRPPVPLWYDLALIMSCAGTGLLLGYLSLADVHGSVERWYGRPAGWVVAIGSLCLSGFGLYLGRFLRWNSWEAFSNPFGLVMDIVGRLTNPQTLVLTVGVTGVFGVGLILGYAALRVLTESLAFMNSQDVSSTRPL